MKRQVQALVADRLPMLHQPLHFGKVAGRQVGLVGHLGQALEQHIDQR